VAAEPKACLEGGTVLSRAPHGVLSSSLRAYPGTGLSRRAIRLPRQGALTLPDSFAGCPQQPASDIATVAHPCSRPSSGPSIGLVSLLIRALLMF